MTAANPTNAAHPRLAAADLPVLTEEVTGFQPDALFLTTEKHTLGIKNPKPTTISRDITESRSLMSALKQLIAAAGLVAATGSKTTSNIKPTELALRTRNGHFFREALDTGSNLEAAVQALDTRAQRAAAGLEPVKLVEAALAPATVSTIERAATQAVPSTTSPAVDLELPDEGAGADRTVLLTPADHLEMQEQYAREDLNKITGGRAIPDGPDSDFDDIFKDSAFDDEPPRQTLKQRILAGLPGALTSGIVVAATKVGVMSALGASVSAFALAPAITTIGGIGAGIFVGQSVAHLRARWAEAEAAKGEKISLRQIFKSASGENISREWTAYRDAINNRDGKGFWKQALVKGTFAASIGAAIAWSPELSNLATEQLNKTQTGAAVVKSLSSTFNTFADKANAVANTAKTTFAKYWPFGKPAAVPVPVQAAQPAPAPAPQAAAPVQEPAPQAAQAAAEPPAPEPAEEILYNTPMDKARAMLQELGVSDSAAAKLLDRAGVTEAQRINDVAVGLNNGIYGMPLNKGAALELFQTAKDMGNAKSAYDLGVATGKIVPPVPAADPVPTPAETPNNGRAEGSTITDDQRRAALAQVGLEFQPAAEAAAPAADLPAGERPVTEADAPKRIGTEAARCVLEQLEKGKNAIRSLCKVFADTMQQGDHVLIEGQGVGRVPYEANEAGETTPFMRASRRNFRDTLFVPWMQRDAQ